MNALTLRLLIENTNEHCNLVAYDQWIRNEEFIIRQIKVEFRYARYSGFKLMEYTEYNHNNENLAKITRRSREYPQNDICNQN